MTSSLFSAKVLSGRTARRQLPTDPNVWLCSDEQPAHVQVVRSVELGQALVRSTTRIRTALAQAGFPQSQTVRNEDCDASRALLSTQFLLGSDDDRIGVKLLLEVAADGAVCSSLLVGHGDSFAPTTLFHAGHRLGQLDWSSAEIADNQVSRKAMAAQMEDLGLLDSSQFLPEQWVASALAALEP